MNRGKAIELVCRTCGVTQRAVAEQAGVGDAIGKQGHRLTSALSRDVGFSEKLAAIQSDTIA